MSLLFIYFILPNATHILVYYGMCAQPNEEAARVYAVQMLPWLHAISAACGGSGGIKGRSIFSKAAWTGAVAQSSALPRSLSHHSEMMPIARTGSGSGDGDGYGAADTPGLRARVISAAAAAGALFTSAFAATVGTPSSAAGNYTATGDVIYNPVTSAFRRGGRGSDPCLVGTAGLVGLVARASQLVAAATAAPHPLLRTNAPLRAVTAGAVSRSPSPPLVVLPPSDCLPSNPLRAFVGAYDAITITSKATAAAVAIASSATCAASGATVATAQDRQGGFRSTLGAAAAAAAAGAGGHRRLRSSSSSSASTIMSNGSSPSGNHVGEVMIVEYLLGYCCSRGLGTPRSDEQATRHFLTAAAMGSAEAQVELGILCQRQQQHCIGSSTSLASVVAVPGEGGGGGGGGREAIPGSISQPQLLCGRTAVQWFQAAAAQDHAEALCHLAHCYVQHSKPTHFEPSSRTDTAVSTVTRDKNILPSPQPHQQHQATVQVMLQSGLQCWLRAARLGHAGAQFQLAEWLQSHSTSNVLTRTLTLTPQLVQDMLPPLLQQQRDCSGYSTPDSTTLIPPAATLEAVVEHWLREAAARNHIGAMDALGNRLLEQAALATATATATSPSPVASPVPDLSLGTPRITQRWPVALDPVALTSEAHEWFAKARTARRPGHA